MFRASMAAITLCLAAACGGGEPRADDAAAGGSPPGAERERTAFRLRDTSEWNGMLEGGRRVVLEVDGRSIDTVDAGFGVHVVGRDSLLFLPVRTNYFEVEADGDSVGYPGITKHVLWSAGRPDTVERRLPWFSSYFSSPSVHEGALHYWGMRALRPEGSRYLLYAARWRIAADVVDTLALDSLTLETDARGALEEPVLSGDGHAIYRTTGLAFRVAPDYRSRERLP